MPKSEANPDNVAQELYKRNAELAVKNKTLSLLGKLYEISILALEPVPLAERVTQTIQAELDFDLVGIFRYEAKNNQLVRLGFAKSKRLERILGKSEKAFDALKIEKASKHNVLGPLFAGSKMVHVDDLTGVWDDLVPKEVLLAAKEKGHLRTVLSYPLMENRMVEGLLIIGLNRVYDDLSEFEQESIRNFVYVITAALGKALLYQELEITNEKLAQSNDALTKLDQAKSEFISIASHQLRAPLTVIKGYISMVTEGSFDEIGEKTRSALSKVAISTEQLIKLIGDMLNLSRIESGKIQYQFVESEFVSVVKAVIDEYQPEAKKKQIGLIFDNKAGSELEFKFDPDKIREVIINLLHNAIKYTGEGKKINVILEKDDSKKVTLSVRDEGIGIKKEDLPKLFTKFVRTEEAKASDPSGMGIGIYFVKRVTEDHGGRAWAESEGIGKGSTFVVELPMPI